MSKTKFTSSWRSNDGGKMTPALAREMLSTFKISHLSAAAFARQYAIPKSRLIYWRHRIAEIDKGLQKPQASTTHSNFAPVMTKEMPPRTAAAPPPLQTLEATLASGRRIVVHGSWDALSMKSWLAAIEAKA